MKFRSWSAIPAGLILIVTATGVNVNAEPEAVLLRVDDDTQQVRVEAYDAQAARWLAVASGYRDSESPGWLKVPFPEAYANAQLRVRTSAEASPFAGKLQSAALPEKVALDYPPSSPRAYSLDNTAEGGGASDPVIEEADIWAFDGDILYFYNQYRGLQVINVADPEQPVWMDYYRYPAKGEDLYSLGGGQVVLIGTGSYWQGEALTLKFMQFDGVVLNETDSVELGNGDYMDSRRYGDYLYILTREWIEQLNPDNHVRNAPLIRLYTVALTGAGEERILDVQSFESDGWLDAVLTAQPGGILLSINHWHPRTSTGGWRWSSDVHVLVPAEDGIPELVGVAPLNGVLQDKFKMNYVDGLLTTVSQQADWATGQFSRSTMLENFRLGDSGFEKIGHLALAPGESLFATRFYGDNVYVVTFLRIDPLFSIDNSNPAKPVVAGELEIPGWSNYIEWVDQFLFAVGIEDNKVTVSTFDVADPANMSMKDRVFLNEDSWAWSEAQYDDQAIAFYPASKLLMLPFTTWAWSSPEMIQAMQLVTWDLDGMLSLRGRIQHLDVPRRGALRDGTVFTISGRQLVATDVSNPDVPEEQGSSTLAWDVRYLIPHGDYLLQLESPEQGYAYWRSPYSPQSESAPILFVTGKLAPNVPTAEVPLATGRLLGVQVRDHLLILLQDLSGSTDPYAWELPEKQDLALRVYDITDPLAPVLLQEDSVNLPYLGSAFDARELSGGHLLWVTRNVPMYGIWMLDFAWPGFWYGQQATSFLTTRITESGQITWGESYTLPDQDYWYTGSEWFWEDPLLVASHTTYTELQVPQSYPRYEANTVLKAFDFSDPATPVQLPEVSVPYHLADLRKIDDAGNHFLYFEPDYRTLEVWGWDGASAFALFKQELFPENSTDRSYTLDWVAPFHMRSRYFTEENVWKQYLEFWWHGATQNRFSRVQSFLVSDDWIRANSDAHNDYLVLTRNHLNGYALAQEGNWAGVTLKYELELPFPNLYSTSLDAVVLGDDAVYLPSGIYGIDTLELPVPDASGAGAERANLDMTESGWREIPGTAWQRTAAAAADAAGAVASLQWLYRPDGWPVVDPQAVDLGDGWRDSSWFGYYAHSTSVPARIHHIEHGWLYVPESGTHPLGGLLYHDPAIGWLWTQDSCYPFLYSCSRQEWIYYAVLAGDGSRWFYGLGSGWFSLP